MTEIVFSISELETIKDVVADEIEVLCSNGVRLGSGKAHLLTMLRRISGKIEEYLYD